MLYSKWQFSDDWGHTKGKWHPYGLCMRVMFFVSLFIVQFYPSDYKDYILAGAINIMLWEVAINILALKKPWYYKGVASKIDTKVGRKKWWFYFGFLAGAIIFKIIKPF